MSSGSYLSKVKHRPGTLRERSDWKRTRGFSPRTCARCAFHAKTASSTHKSITPDQGGPLPPRQSPRKTYRRWKAPRPAPRLGWNSKESIRDQDLHLPSPRRPRPRRRALAKSYRWMTWFLYCTGTSRLSMRHNGHTIALIGEGDVFTTVVRPEPFDDVADTETETSGGNVYHGRQCGRRTKRSVASGVEAIVGVHDRGTCFPFGVGGFDQGLSGYGFWAVIGYGYTPILRI